MRGQLFSSKSREDCEHLFLDSDWVGLSTFLTCIQQREALPCNVRYLSWGFAMVSLEAKLCKCIPYDSVLANFTRSCHSGLVSPCSTYIRRSLIGITLPYMLSRKEVQERSKTSRHVSTKTIESVSIRWVQLLFQTS